MQPGRYDQRLAIEELVRVDDQAGGAEKTYREIARCWAAVWPIGARDQFTAGQVEGISSFRVRIRRRAGMKVTHRFIWLTNGNQVLDIKGPGDQGPRADYMEFLVDMGAIGNG